MKTALDSNIISAIFGLEQSSDALIELLGSLRLEGALVICGAVYAEIHAIPRMTPTLLAEFLADTGIAIEAQTSIVIDRKKLHMDQIKTLGTHSVIAKLHADVEFPVTVEVVAK